MEIGQRVKINMSDTVWHDKEGVVEDIQDSICTVFVDFIPEEGKKIRQDFNLENINETLKESLKNKNTNEIGDIVKDFNNGFVLFKTKDGKQSQVAKDELEEFEDTEEVKTVLNATTTESFDKEYNSISNPMEARWFKETDKTNSLLILERLGLDVAIKMGKVKKETLSSNDKYSGNVTVYALKKGIGSGNQFRAYFYIKDDTCVFVRCLLKKKDKNGPAEIRAIQDTINDALKSVDK